MTREQHDAVVTHIAKTRFPFHDQKDWPADYVTLTNVGRPTRSIPYEGREHFPDIVIVNTKGEIREIGEVEEELDETKAAIWKTCSAAADNLTETGNRHFFLYVPSGREDEAVALLEDGARVGIIADDVEPLATLVAVYYDRILPVETNVRDADAVERGIALTREHFGWIDRLRTP